MSIPDGSTARVNLPLDSKQIIEIKKNSDITDLNQMEGVQTGQFLLTSGDYIITVSSD